MVLSRNRFFIVLVVLFVGPFFAYKIAWLSLSEKTMGRVLFRGRVLEVQGTSDHSLIKYKAGQDSLLFNTEDDLEMKKGEIVSVRFQKNNPADACVNDFVGIWLGTVIYAFFPFSVILVLFFTPQKLDPLIPKKSRIVVGRKPLIRIIPGSIQVSGKN
jgi:hypothetical protein